MPRYAFRLEFDGRDWSGTAPQIAGTRTLDAALRHALHDHTGQHHRPITAGRLDAGVSALDFVCHCDLDEERPPATLGRLLNARLPSSIAITAVAPVPDTWHARLSSVAKTYRYRLLERGVRSPFDRDLVWIKPLPHPERLQPFSQHLIGSHDLSGFACLRHDTSDHADPHHTITAADWEAVAHRGGILRTFRIRGDGFLYRQVRGFVGALLAVARDRRGTACERFHASLAGGRDGQTRSGDIAPAHGLTLETITYDPIPDWHSLA